MSSRLLPAVFALVVPVAAHGGKKSETSEAIKSAIEEAQDRGPATNASEIPALARLLEKAGWTPTPELSGVFQPGAIFEETPQNHALLAADCIQATPQENTYTSAELVTSLQAGVSVKAGLGAAAVSGGLVKKVKFATPMQLSVPTLDLVLTPECAQKLRRLPEAQVQRAYVVREVLRAEIAEQTCGRIDASGRMVGLGAAEAQFAAACAQESLEPVGVGYRTVPLTQLLAAASEVPPADAPATAASPLAAAAMAPDTAAPVPSAPATGPFAIVFNRSKTSCNWSVEDIPTGRSTSLFASRQCPSELIWQGEDTLYYQDGETFYLLRAGERRAEPVPRPKDARCDAESSWLAPRVAPSTGRVHWACWSEADKSEELGPQRYRVCSGEICAEDQGLSQLAIPIVVKDYVYSDDGSWQLHQAYADCDGTEGCWFTVHPLGPLGAEGDLPAGTYALSTIESKNLTFATGCPGFPEEWADDPSLMAMMGLDGEWDWICGSALGEDGYLLWARHNEAMGGYGPAVLCDATCRRRRLLETSRNSQLRIGVSGAWAILEPYGDQGETGLVSGATQAVVRSWSEGHEVLLLPEGVTPPLGVVP